MDTKFAGLMADTAEGFSPFYGAYGHTLKQQRSRRQALDNKPLAFWPLPLNGSVAVSQPSVRKRADW